MNLREAILDALADEGESIVQIKEYVRYLKIPAKSNEIKEMLNDLYINNKIKIVYPNDLNLTNITNYKNIKDLWFEMTEDGRLEWDKIK